MNLNYSIIQEILRVQMSLVEEKIHNKKQVLTFDVIQVAQVIPLSSCCYDSQTSASPKGGYFKYDFVAFSERYIIGSISRLGFDVISSKYRKSNSGDKSIEWLCQIK